MFFYKQLGDVQGLRRGDNMKTIKGYTLEELAQSECYVTVSGDTYDITKELSELYSTKHGVEVDVLVKYALKKNLPHIYGKGTEVRKYTCTVTGKLNGLFISIEAEVKKPKNLMLDPFSMLTEEMRRDISDQFPEMYSEYKKSGFTRVYMNAVHAKAVNTTLRKYDMLKYLSE